MRPPLFELHASLIWAAISLLLSATQCASTGLGQYEIIEHQYAFNVPTWSPFSSNTPHPLVIWHGLGDSGYSSGMVELKNTLEQAYPRLYVHLVALADSDGSDRNRGVFGRVDDDVEQVCEELSNVNQLKGGFDAIGFSQGGQFLRALVQRCEKVQVRNLITFGSQHMGISDLPACSPADFLCRLAEGALRGGIYTDYAQTHVVSAQYFRDPRSIEKLQRYLDANKFLTDINNEVKQNEEYKKRLSSLETFVMLQFDQDKTVVPKRSSWFEAFPTKADDDSATEGDNDNDNNKKEETIPLRQSEIYTSDRLGLRQLDKRGSLVLDTCKGRHMQIDAACQLKIFGKYVATPKSAVPRTISDTWNHVVHFTTGLHPTSLPWTVHFALVMALVVFVEVIVVLVAPTTTKLLRRRKAGMEEGRIRLA